MLTSLRVAFHAHLQCVVFSHSLWSHVQYHAMPLQAKKVYVQDRLRESGKLVWQLLQEGAHFYVCGDAAHMAGSAEQALLHIIQHHQV